MDRILIKLLKMDSRLRGNDREASYGSWLPLYKGVAKK